MINTTPLFPIKTDVRMIYDFSVSFYVELLAGLSRQNRQLACKLTLFARIVRKKASNNVVFWREIFEF